ncbi:FmdB family zinc ribbon protein [Arthrobacter halodurans]|jgi:putative FmdB family regulatory protein|uniref:FmdB family zinc ribbon protein n=1 Tax=Arthrobacter halodurans TaxID=516699 RepID=A0ABV4ULJ9_9MICC
MPLYEFRCPEGTTFEASFPMGQAPAELACAQCGEPAGRRISAPRLSVAGSAAFGLIDSTLRSAHEPEVVTGLPGRSRRPATRYTTHPLHQKLPRD